MRWFPEPHRALSEKEVVWCSLALAMIVAFFSSVLARQGIPSFSEVAFGTFPQTLFVFIGVASVLMLIGRQRSDAAFAHAAIIGSVTIVGSYVLAAVLRQFYPVHVAVLTPWDAGIAIATGGMMPFEAGIFFTIRFLPVISAIGIAIALMRRVAFSRMLIGALSWYLFASLMVHALSWIAGALAVGGGVLQNGADVFRVLLGAQRDGYWTVYQQERFFASTGQQNETALFAVEAGILFLMIVGVLGGMAWRHLTAFGALAKRLATRSVGTFLVMAVIGLAIGTARRDLHPSYTDMIAQIVFLITVLLWSVAWRLRRDLEHVAADMVSRPRLPLPAGEIEPHDLERIIFCTETLWMFGALLLGWPVFLPLCIARAMTWVCSSRGMGWGNSAIRGSIGALLTASCLGIAALDVGLRHAPPADSMLLLIATASLIVGIADLFGYVRDTVESRLPVAFGILLAVLLVLGVSRQPVLLYFMVPFGVVWLWIAQKPSLWHRFGVYPLYGLLAGMLCVELFFPALLKTFSL